MVKGSKFSVKSFCRISSKKSVGGRQLTVQPDGVVSGSRGVDRDRVLIALELFGPKIFVSSLEHPALKF